MKKMNFLITGIILVIAIVIGVTSTGLLTLNEEKDYLKIGFVGPLSGDLSFVGEVEKDAVYFAVDEINEKGGIIGQKIKLFYEDGRCDSKEAINATNKLINIDNVDILIGYVCSSEAISSVPISKDHNKLIFITGSNPDLIHLSDTVFRTYPSDSYLVDVLSDYIYTQGYRRIGVITENIEFNTSISRYFQKNLEDKDVFIFEENIDSKETDFRTIILRLKSQKIDSLFINIQSFDSLSALTRQLEEFGLRVQYFGNIQFTISEVVLNSGPGINGLIYIDNTNVEELDRFNILEKEYFKKTNKKIEFPYIFGARYDSVYLIKDAIEYCGEYEISCVDNYLKSLENFDGVIGNFSFNKYGDIIKTDYVIKQIVDADNLIVEVIN